jgi:predicted NUDIX family NTP pyrophosphohydrolase
MKQSAGILLYRRSDDTLFEVFLAHPGGPFWETKDEGAWTIPKGLVEEGEELLASAIRELEEETGVKAIGPFTPLGSIVQKNKKVVHAWACEQDVDPGCVTSNMTTVRWAGKKVEIPEVDRCSWFDPETAMWKINPAQAELILRLAKHLSRAK